MDKKDIDPAPTSVPSEIPSNNGFQIRHGLWEAGFKGAGAVCDFYNKNAVDYDEYSSLTGRSAGACAIATAVAKSHPSHTTTILDVCAGSGLAGEELQKLGYTLVDALDFSHKMLDLAKSKNLYRHYICDSVQLQPQSQVPDKHGFSKEKFFEMHRLLTVNKVVVCQYGFKSYNSYDVCCMNGGMCRGHITPDLLPEFTRMTKSGGSIVFNVTEKRMELDPEYHEKRIEENLDSYVSNESWKSWSKETAVYHSTTGETCVVYTGNVA